MDTNLLPCAHCGAPAYQDEEDRMVHCSAGCYLGSFWGNVTQWNTRDGVDPKAAFAQYRSSIEFLQAENELLRSEIKRSKPVVDAALFVYDNISNTLNYDFGAACQIIIDSVRQSGSIRG